MSRFVHYVIFAATTVSLIAVSIPACLDACHGNFYDCDCGTEDVPCGVAEIGVCECVADLSNPEVGELKCEGGGFSTKATCEVCKCDGGQTKCLGWPEEDRNWFWVVNSCDKIHDGVIIGSASCPQLDEGYGEENDGCIADNGCKNGLLCESNPWGCFVCTSP